MKIKLTILPALFIFVVINVNDLFAQDSPSSCKVALSSPGGKYTGKCKNGLADGKGTYQYNDSVYYTGNFQDGIKEGKGEMHYIRTGLPDSIIKGYWSADEYRGKKYKTYNFSSSRSFDTYELTPSPGSGNSVTIEISTTSGSPNGAPVTASGDVGYVLTLTSLVSANGDFVTKESNYANSYKSSSTYHINKFPAKLFGTLSDGQTIEIELYKAAKWTVRLFLNK